MKTNRFVYRISTRMTIFEDMINKVCKTAELTKNQFISAEEEAFLTWEKIENQDPQRLIFESKEMRESQIKKIMHQFEKKLTPLIESEEKKEKSFIIIRKSLEKLFEL